MAQKTGEILLTSKVGTFRFPAGTKLSRAKLVRDTVMGGVLNPAENQPRLRLYGRDDEVNERINRYVGHGDNILFTLNRRRRAS